MQYLHYYLYITVLYIILEMRVRTFIVAFCVCKTGIIYTTALYTRCFCIFSYYFGLHFDFVFSKMDQVTKFIEPGRQFAKDSIRLVKRCTKPDRKGMFIIIDYNDIFYCLCVRTRWQLISKLLLVYFYSYCILLFCLLILICAFVL